MTVKNNPALRALALREGKTHVLQRPTISLPSTLVYLDVEGLPDENLVYLIGILVVQGPLRSFHQFWADSPKDCVTIWRQASDLINSLSDYMIIHYGKYDVTYMRQMQKECGGLNDQNWEQRVFNALSAIYGQVYFPTYGNGLKEVAAAIGFRWNDSAASGLQSIAWRIHWERSLDSALKNKLLTYNKEDCEALEVVTRYLKSLESDHPSTAVNCDKIKREHPFRWGKNSFVFPEFEDINQRAYFDYQQNKIYWRTDNASIRRREKVERTLSRKPRINKTVVSPRARQCPSCASRRVVKHTKARRVIYDLKFTASGVKRWIVEYNNHRYRCQNCSKTFQAPEHPSAERYGHNLIAWTVYQYIGLRQSQENVALGLNDVFRFNINWRGTVAEFKERAADFYRVTYEEILNRIRNGNLVHVDETHVSIKGVRNYVWVFTNLSEVAYVYSDSREGGIIKEVLNGFKGVMVSDFYPAYEGMDCKQQRCLIHLIRDMNDDLFKNQFDEEYKDFVRAFGVLMKSIVLTIDRYGLKTYYLRRHIKDVERFYRGMVRKDAQSELQKKYQTRFLKNENWLFTFLNHDGVPWNNNNAENAIKGFATLRRVIGGCSTEKGLKDSLALLSIHQSLRNHGQSSLHFFRSGETSLERYLGSI